MKKFAAVILSILMLINGATASAQGYVTPRYLSEMDLTADSWYALDTSRHYFVLCMIMDCMDAWTEDDTVLTAEALNYDSIYMVKDTEDVSVWMFGKNALMIFLYDTKANNAYYQIIDIDNASTKASTYMSALKVNGDIPTYVKIDSSAILQSLGLHT